MIKRMVSGLVVAGFVSMVGSAFAQWPEKPIRIVVPYQSGMSVDVTGRALAQQLSGQLGVPVIVENKPGASGHIGGAYVARSKPDGYTLLLGASSGHVVSPQVLPPLNYNPIGDFNPIALVSRIPNVLVVHPSVPVDTVPEFFTYAKANADSMTFASYGPGSNLHLAGELLNLRLGTQMPHIPYNSSALISDLLSGRIQWMFENASAVMPYVSAGKLKALAVASEDQLNSLEGLPPISRFLPGFSVNAWALLSAPGGTPDDVVNRLAQAVDLALTSDAMRKTLADQYLAPGLLYGADAKAFLDDENSKWQGIVKETGVTVK